MKDRTKSGACKYCGGRVERTTDPIYLYKCQKCEEILLAEEVVERDKGAKT